MIPLSFHPLIRAWFSETCGSPTAVQAEAWPCIEGGEHVLALAPTGSGKTLTAFLSAISRLCPPHSGTGAAAYPADRLSVLYVSPLKALNEDIRRNLLGPLAAIRTRFDAADIPFPPIRVETRSGDTPAPQRRRFLNHPPSILALTPESLAILLLNPRGRQALSTVRYLILDEIHAALGDKRGAFLSCQIDRLAMIAGDFQRVGLSATVRPPEAAAGFLGGIGRAVRIVAPPALKRIEFSIEWTDSPDETPAAGSAYGVRYSAIIGYILERIPKQTTTLVFVDSRRRAERLCHFLNQEAAAQGFGGDVACPHHGSLSLELRRSVERRLAAGSLPCVVATASLELGIDIGSVDEVVLAGSPAAVAQTLQRIGRSGHGVGKTSRGRLFPFHPMDLLQAAALGEALAERDIEETRPIENPLDILAQCILALCIEKDRAVEELYAMLRGFYLFKNLSHESYIRAVRMLAGLGTEGRLRELKPRIWMDQTEGTIGALPGGTLLLYMSGGVIASRGYYSLRLADGTKIGELDEEFVWERRLGDEFDFGGRGWRIAAIEPESVKVLPMDKRPDFVPFWKADTAFRSPTLSARLRSVLDRANAGEDMERGGGLSGQAAAALKAFLDTQLACQGGLPLPGEANITVEIISGDTTQGNLSQAVIHTFRGGAINYPLALALAGELEEKLETRIEVFPNDNAVLFLVPRRGSKADNIEELLSQAIATLQRGEGGLYRGERLFRKRLESSGIFGAQFREAAERSLLLPKAGFGKRTPLWIMRQRSKRLFDAVAAEDGFPVSAEAWRSCLADIFDMAGFRSLLDDIASGAVTLSYFHTRSPSPFSRDLVRQETNALMYEYDDRKDKGGGEATLSDTVIAEALGDSFLRPRLPAELTSGFVSRLRREIPGWTPETVRTLCEWVKERIAIPFDEWEILRAALPQELRLELDAGSGMAGRLLSITRPGAAVASLLHHEWAAAWEEEALTLLGPWLRYQGPVSLARITAVFGITTAEAEDAVNSLAAVDSIVTGVMVESSPEALLCDRENLDLLLRLSRKKARPVIRERPAALLAPFLALRQGITAPDAASNTLFPQALAGYAAPAKLWETEFRVARCGNYQPEHIDNELREGHLVWYGAGRERIGFCRADDLDLVPIQTEECGKDDRGFFTPLFAAGFFDRPRDFWEILEALKREKPELNSHECSAALWQEVWRGRLSSDSFAALRRSLESGFESEEIELAEHGGRHPSSPYMPGRHPRVPRALRDRWRGGSPMPGGWFSLGLDPVNGSADQDPLDEEYRSRDRVRLLLRRYGLLCRPLLEHEKAPCSWAHLLPAMRRMELAGELAAGRFFAGIPSLQFASPAIARELEASESVKGLYWMNAADPASLAGLDAEGLDPRLPSRSAGSRLYYRGAELIAVANRGGKDLRLFLGPGDSDIVRLVSLISIARTRTVLPERKLPVETINGGAAANSKYAEAFRSAGFVSDRGKLCLW